MKRQRIISKDTLFALRFVIAPFTIFLLGKIVFELLAFNFPELNQHLIENFSKTKEIPSIITLKETKARLVWITSVIMYFFICAVFAAFIWDMLRQSLTKTSLLLFIAVALLFSSAEIIYIFMIEDSSKSPLTNIFLFTFNSLKASGQYSEYQLSLLYFTLSVINLLAILITPFGIMTGCCIMNKYQAHTNTNLDNILGQSKHIKELLMGGSAVMVIGIAHMQLWLNWPLSFLSDDTIRQQIEAITLAVSQYWGVIYTLTMAALYLPIAFSLSVQAREIIQSENHGTLKKNPDLWLAENKKLMSLNSQLPQLAAVIAPMLVGSFGSTLGKIMPF